MNDYKARFLKLMLGLSENFSANLTDNGLSLRYEALKQYQIESLENAAIELLRTRKYTTMPTVADFVELLEGSKADKAEYQFSLVVRAIKQTGRNKNPKFKDPVTQYLVDERFGWAAICNKPEKDIEFFGKDFKAAYNSHKTIQNTEIGHDERRLIDNETTKKA